MKRYYILLSLIFTLALLVRVVGISSYPVGFTQDEAGIGYDAYSLALTGKDQWGKAWPLTLRSFGDFKMPLYSYLAIPSVYFLGLSEFSVRLPGALLGTLAVFTTYLMAIKLSGRKELALLSAFFLAISPWHIGLSRGAFEANLTTFFITLGVWAFIEGLKSPRLMILSSLSFGLNLFSYHSGRFFTPLLIIILVASFRDNFRGNILNRYKIPILVFGIFAFATFYSMFTGAAKRGLDITIFNPTDNWAYVSNKRYGLILEGTPLFFARLFSNKLLYVFTQFYKNYFSYFSTTFLFSEGVAEANYGLIPGRGVLYALETVFVVASIISFSTKKGFSKMGFIILWAILAPIPAALTKGPGYAANRAATMMPAIQVLSAWGLVFLYGMLKGRFGKGFARVFLWASLIILLGSLALFLADYRYNAPPKNSKSMQYGMRDIMSTINSIEGKYGRIHLSRTLSTPNIWVQFYMKVPPSEVQDASDAWLRYERLGIKYLDQLNGYSLGKFTFGDIAISELQGMNYLVVGRPEEFPSNVVPIASFSYLDGSPSYIMVDANGL